MIPQFVKTAQYLSCSASLTFERYVAVVISVTKEGVKFSTGGDIGSANIVCRQNTSVDKVSDGCWM